MQIYDPFPELGLWVRKQRVAKEQGTLSEERLRILLELGFEFGEEANITEEWEWRFDLLVELLILRVGNLLLSPAASLEPQPASQKGFYWPFCCGLEPDGSPHVFGLSERAKWLV